MQSSPVARQMETIFEDHAVAKLSRGPTSTTLGPANMELQETVLIKNLASDELMSSDYQVLKLGCGPRSLGAASGASGPGQANAHCQCDGQEASVLCL